ncbi:MAG TPA: response regulator [Rhodospirillaceae bacterium]|nr:response regulator [Rhodospirillaceae bacterium]
MEDRILIIDDDRLLLLGLQRQLGEKFDLTLAEGGKSAVAEVLAAQEKNRPFAVVICDMRMPDMDGIQTLRRIHDIAPETTLLMLTGNTDQKTAIDAINEGHVHRFFTKPCPVEVLEGGINEARVKYHQVVAERDLLERTLAGSVKVLVDLLAANDPVTADQATRIRDYVGRLSDEGTFPRRWQLKVSASLALVGQMALPTELLKKKRGGLPLTGDEQAAVARAPELARNLIANIPRLGKVAESIYLQDRGFDGSGFPEDGPTGEDIPMDARILKILKDLGEAATQTGTTDARAFNRLQDQAAQYDPALLSKIRACLQVPSRNDVPDEPPLPAESKEPDVAPGDDDANTAAAPARRPPSSEKRHGLAKRGAEERSGRTAVVLLSIVLVAGIVMAKWYFGRDHETDSIPAQTGVLLDQMDAVVKGTAMASNVFGGTIVFKNGNVEVGGIPRAACVQASWLLGRKGVLAINGVLAQRLTGTFIAKSCRSVDANTLSWTPEGPE